MFKNIRKITAWVLIIFLVGFIGHEILSRSDVDPAHKQVKHDDADRWGASNTMAQRENFSSKADISTPQRVRTQRIPAIIRHSAGFDENLSAKPHMLKTRITSHNSTDEVEPCELGMFPAVSIQGGSKIDFLMNLEPHEGVVVQAVDGGHLDDIKQAVELSADSRGVLAFAYQSRSEIGNYRVTLALRGERYTFNLLVN